MLENIIKNIICIVNINKNVIIKKPNLQVFSGEWYPRGRVRPFIKNPPSLKYLYYEALIYLKLYTYSSVL